jgi:phospholipid-binding lipoprotein MlaA
MKKILLAALALGLAGCAAIPSGQPDPRDPWERFNRASYKFNDSLDRAVAKPVAKAYKKVTPRVVRTGIGNFISNLGSITTIVNDVLQGKMKQAGRDSGRFLLNSTLGLAGLFDPASAAGIERGDEDFGQTLGKWGVRSGPYLMLPFLGPSTVRDTAGRIPDQFTNPLNYVDEWEIRYGVRALDFLELRAGLLDLDAQIQQSHDPYAFIRNAWLQRREFQVTDGNIEDPSLELEEGMLDEPEAAPSPPAEKPADAAPAPAPGG